MKWAPFPQQILRGGILKYWNENRKQYYTHVEPRADWREPVEKWVDWMDVVGRTKQTLRTVLSAFPVFSSSQQKNQ